MKFRIGQIADIFNNDDLRTEMLHVQHFAMKAQCVDFQPLKEKCI